MVDVRKGEVSVGGVEMRFAGARYFCLVFLTVAFFAPPAVPAKEFRFSETALRQARETAKREFIQDLKERRPAGLESLENDQEIQRAVQGCIAELGHEDFDVQQKAVGKLRYLGRRAFPDLVKGLESENPVRRKWCAVLLGHLGRAAVDPLSEALGRDAVDYVRSAAATSLGYMRDPRAVPALLDALTDEDFDVMFSAINALEYLRDERAFEPLQELLEDNQTEHQLHLQASRALMSIDEERARKVIESKIEEVSNQYARHNLRVALESRRNTNYWPPDVLDLRQLAQDAGTIVGERFGEEEIDRLVGYMESADRTVVGGCLGALGELRAVSAVPAIVKSARKGSFTFSVLAKIGSEQAVDTIIEALESPDAKTRQSAVEGFVYEGRRWPVPLLIELLDDPDLRMKHKGKAFPIDAFDGIWPDEHWAHSALFGCLSRSGLRGRSLNLARGGSFDVDEEIQRLRVWWGEHGTEFLEGKQVPSPEITFVLLSS